MSEHQLPWGKLLIELSRHLTRDHLEEAWVYVRTHIPQSNDDAKSTWLKLFTALEDAGAIDVDSTAYLKEVLQNIGALHCIETVEAYERKYQEYIERIKLLRGQHDPYFIGRQKEINEALRFLENPDDKIKCLYIHGMTGLGKTKLAQQITAYYATANGLDKTGMRMARLHKVTSTHEMGVIILRELGMRIAPSDYDEDILFETLCMRKQRTLLLLDNADDLLCPTSQSADNFKNQLSALLDCSNKFIKFIVTSRYPIDFVHLTQKDSFHAISVQPLDELDSIKLLRKASRSPSQPSPLERGAKTPLDDEYAKELAVTCGCCPKMLRAVASRLRNGIKAARLLEMLARPDKAHVALTLPPEEDEGYLSMGEDVEYERDVLPKMGQMIGELTPELKEILIRLSVFPSAFSDADAASVLDQGDADVIDFHLDDLKNRWGMLEGELDLFEDEENRPKWYSMHALVRTSCLRECYSDDNSKNVFHDALHRFSEKMGSLLDEIAILANINAQQGFLKLDRSQANIMHYLEVQSGCKLDDSSKPLFPRSLALPVRQSSVKKTGLSKSHTFLEKFLETKKRLYLFEGMARQAESRDVEEWALYMAWAQDQNIDMLGFQVPIEKLTPVIAKLQSHNGLSDKGQLALAQCMYVKGRAYVAMPDPDLPQGLKLLEEAKALQQKYGGDPTLLARTINSVGSLYFKKGETNKSLENHLQAWQIIGQITNGNPEQHFDSPQHIMNIGTCYYSKGNEWSNKDKPKEAEKCYKESIAYYDRALRIQRSLGLQKSVYIARIIRNKSLSLFEMERYDEALKFAVEALNMRKNTYDRHRDNLGLKDAVARSYYQVGMCYHRRGEQKKKAGETVDKIDDLKEAEKYYHEALKLTLELGYDRRIYDYEELKEDYLELTQMIRGAKHRDKLERAFVNFEVRLLDVPQFLQQQAAAGQEIGRLPALDPEAHFSEESHSKKCRLS